MGQGAGSWGWVSGQEQLLLPGGSCCPSFQGLSAFLILRSQHGRTGRRRQAQSPGHSNSVHPLPLAQSHVVDAGRPPPRSVRDSPLTSQALPRYSARATRGGALPSENLTRLDPFPCRLLPPTSDGHPKPNHVASFPLSRHPGATLEPGPVVAPYPCLSDKVLAPTIPHLTSPPPSCVG